LKSIAALRIIRPINCVMIGIAVIIGEFIALAEAPQFGSSALGFLTGFFLMAGTMAMNDYYDLEIDRINSPRRPLPSGTLTSREVISIGLIACSVGLATAALLNMSGLVIAAFSLSLMIYYNTRGKRTGFFGNVLVSICIGLPFIFGGAAVGKIAPVLIFFSLNSFTANLGRELTKGIADVEGDRSKKVNTIAVVYSPKTASRLAAVLYLVAVGMSFAPPVLGLVKIGYIPPVAASDAGFVTTSFSLMRKYDKGNARLSKNRVLIWMCFGLLAFVAGSIGDM
jgi:geranylgeranylglycerol-phosphate geranylgeranyltransferase